MTDDFEVIEVKKKQDGETKNVQKGRLVIRNEYKSFFGVGKEKMTMK